MNPETVISGWQNLAALALLALASLDILRRCRPAASFSSIDSKTAAVCSSDRLIPATAPKVCGLCTGCSVKNDVKVHQLKLSSDR